MCLQFEFKSSCGSCGILYGFLVVLRVGVTYDPGGQLLQRQLLRQQQHRGSEAVKLWAEIWNFTHESWTSHHHHCLACLGKSSVTPATSSSNQGRLPNNYLGYMRRTGPLDTTVGAVLPAHVEMQQFTLHQHQIVFICGVARRSISDHSLVYKFILLQPTK